jgi:glycine cleavage system H protein
MSAPDDRRYLESHEWHKPEGDLVAIGISRFAVDELTDLTFLEITAEGTINKGDPLGEVESVKATSELYCGIDAEVVEVNQAVVEDPSLINRDCYEEGWIVKVRPRDAAQLDELMSAETYQKRVGV